MDPVAQTAFNRVKATLEARDFPLSHIFSTIAEFALQRPQVAFALSSHARDILDGQGYFPGGVELMAEILRRTFFERTHAEKYGTQELLDAGGEMLTAFADYLVTSFAMSDAQAAAGMAGVENPSQRH